MASLKLLRDIKDSVMTLMDDARWQPVTSRLSYGKIEDCEQSSADIESELFVAV